MLEEAIFRTKTNPWKIHVLEIKCYLKTFSVHYVSPLEVDSVKILKIKLECVHACMCLCVCFCFYYPSKYLRLKQQLIERHHCIVCGEKGHKAWMNVVVGPERLLGWGGMKVVQVERKCENEQLFFIPQLMCLPSLHSLSLSWLQVLGRYTHAEIQMHTCQNVPPVCMTKQPHIGC